MPTRVKSSRWVQTTGTKNKGRRVADRLLGHDRRPETSLERTENHFHELFLTESGAIDTQMEIGCAQRVLQEKGIEELLALTFSFNDFLFGALMWELMLLRESFDAPRQRCHDLHMEAIV